MENLPEISKKNPNWSGFLGAIFFFAGLPIALLNLAWHFIDTQEYNRRISESFNFLEQNLFRLKRESSDSKFINKKLNALFGILSEENLASSTIEASLKEIEADKFPFISFNFFDSKSEVIPLKNQPTEYKAILTRMFSAICEYETTGKPTLLKQYRPLFHSFLGNIEPELIIAEKGNLLKVTLKGKPGYFYWNSFEKVPEGHLDNSGKPKTKESESVYQGGMIVYLEEEKIPPNLALKDILESLNRNSPNGDFFGVINLENSENSFPNKNNKEVQKLFSQSPDTIVTKMQSQFKRREFIPSGILAILPLDAVQVVFGLRKGEYFKKSTLGLFVKILSLAILIFVVFWEYKIQISGTFFYLSIRKKLVGLFLYATAIPVTAFLLLGFQYVSNRKKVMLQEHFSKLTSFNETIDENFDGAKQTLQKFYRRFSKSSFIQNLNFEKLSLLAKNQKFRRVVSTFYIITGSGNFLFTTETREGMKAAGAKLLPALARRIFSKKFGESIDSLKNRFSDAVVESFSDSVAEFLIGKDSKVLFSELLEKTDKIHELVTGNTTNFLFTSFFRSEKRKEDLLLVIFHMKRKLASNYLNIIVKNNSRQNEARNPIRILYAENFGAKNVIEPKDYMKYPFIKELQEKVAVTQSPQNEIGEIAGEKFLAAASPMTKLSDFIVISLYPQRLIDKTLWEISVRIALVSIVSGLFAFFIGVKLSRQFLWPIKELSLGIAAIRRRDFSHRIPNLDNDELGDLGITFNQVIENFEEMHVAKIVQETLFPEGAIWIGEYEIFGKSKSMSYLGGDYFDYFAVDDRYAVILIGDVTGHGVPAALLMAMAKSGVSLLPREEIMDVPRTLQRLNTMIIETMKKKKLMTFFLSVLDTLENRLISGNAGHNFPLYFSALSGTVNVLECPSYPLGARKKAIFEERRLGLEPGDAIVFYTDGIVEAKNSSGEFLDYPGLAKLFRDAVLRTDNARSIHDFILRGYEQHLGKGVPQDDVTLIVVKRSAAGHFQNSAGNGHDPKVG